VFRWRWLEGAPKDPIKRGGGDWGFRVERRATKTFPLPWVGNDLKNGPRGEGGSGERVEGFKLAEKEKRGW